MLAQLLNLAGHNVKCVSIGTVDEMLAQAEHDQPDIICISAIPPLALTHARAIYGRLRTKFPSQATIIGLWNYSGDVSRSANRIDTPERVRVFTTLAEVMLQVKIQVELLAGAAHARQPVTSVHGSH